MSRCREEGVSMPSLDRDRYLANLQGEIDGIALYRTLAELETNPELASVYRRMAEAEERHADL
jgi:rubrerythrin